MGGDSPKLDSLSDPDRMLGAAEAWKSAGVLRRMYNVITTGADTVRTVVAKAKLSAQLGPN